MSIVQRLKRRLRKPVQRIVGHDEDARFRLRLPSPSGKGDWLAFDCVLTTREDGMGEHWRLRTHLRADFSRVLQPLGKAPDEAPMLRLSDHSAEKARPPGSAMVRIGAGATGAMQRVLATRIARRALAPLADQRVESWMDVHGTTAMLDAGSEEMLPKGLARIGVVPAADGPPIQSWSAPTPTGMAQITTLHLDERHIHQSARARRAGERPLRVAATFAQIVEKATDDDRD